VSANIQQEGYTITKLCAARITFQHFIASTAMECLG